MFNLGQSRAVLGFKEGIQNDKIKKLFMRFFCGVNNFFCGFISLLVGLFFVINTFFWYFLDIVLHRRKLEH